MIKRLCNPLLSRSFFLFGARATGKTTLLKQLLEAARPTEINLLLPNDFDEFALYPDSLRARADAIKDKDAWIVIDEIQKLPRLLDVVHHIIETTNIKFAMTGSSARKLIRSGANLLAGRASVFHLYPFSYRELGNQFSLQDALMWGTLPSVCGMSNEERTEFLRAYAFTYLKEEIAEEQAVRKLEPFRRFLEVAALSNTKIINFKKIADDVGTTSVSVKSYFQVLEDTLLGSFLEPFHESVRKSQRQNPKFYFFDAGVERALTRSLDMPVRPGTSTYGAAFESYLVNEIIRLNSYYRKDFKLSYLRTKDDAEIDLIIDRTPSDRILIEIKSSSLVRESDARTLRSFCSSIKHEKALLVSQDPNEKKFDTVRALHWEKALFEIFDN